MRIARLAGILIFLSFEALADPCDGKGTLVVLVNGVSNTASSAKETFRKFEEITRPHLPGIVGLRYDLAFVEGRGVLLDVMQTAIQRGFDDFSRFWLWVEGIEVGPEWFEKAMHEAVFNPRWLSDASLPGLGAHLEKYSDALLKGFEVILVSHSSGNFYANAALRLLPEYASVALQPSLLDRRKRNALYPRPEEMVANVQIASPVKETVNDSPWVSFKDDLVLRFIRSTVGALPGNIDSMGISTLDQRGHSLIPSYLGVDESRQRIIDHIRAAHQRLRYPIPYFESAATVE